MNTYLDGSDVFQLFKKQYKPDDQKSLKKQDNINDMNIV
jgi:hypothetical protein